MGTVVIKMLLQSIMFMVLARVFGRDTREKGFVATENSPSAFDCANQIEKRCNSHRMVL